MVSHDSPTDSISVHRKLLRKFIVKLRADRRSYRKKHAPIQTPSEGGANSEVLAEVAWNWPQRVSHAQKDAIVRDFCSVTSSWPSTQAPKSITCASCAERVRHDKQCVIRLVSYSLCTVFCEYDVCGPGLCRLPALCLIRKTGDIYISAVYVEGFH